MENQRPINLEITIIGPDGITNRELSKLREELYTKMEEALIDDNVFIRSEDNSRSIDPIVIGTIAITLLPIIVGKAADSLIKWMELRKDCSVRLYVPIDDSPPVEITYNPRTTSLATINKWIDSVNQIYSKEGNSQNDES